MGAEQSKLDGDAIKQAFHVLRVDENSPASAAKLCPYFDYITSVNGVEVIQEVPNVVAEMAKNHVDRPMKATVYNSRTDATREATIVPSRNWPGKTLLGASIRYCQVTSAIDRVWHVLDVNMDSPAYRAGLVPQKDWIIGSPDIAINSTDDFYNLMIHNQKRPVRLLVFNIDQEAVRETNVIPDFDWGGQGCLGCDVASGALHRIPPPSTGATGVPMSVPAPLMPADTGAQYQDTPLSADPSHQTVQQLGCLPQPAEHQFSRQGAHEFSHQAAHEFSNPGVHQTEHQFSPQVQISYQDAPLSAAVPQNVNLQPIPGFESVDPSREPSFLQ